MEKIKVAIYGAGEKGRELFEKISKCEDVEVAFFIDKDAENIIEKFGKKVLTLKETSGIKNKDELIIVLAISNVFIHIEIADMIYSEGFSKIIYKDVNCLTNSTNENYDKVMKEGIVPQFVSSYVPKVDGYSKRNLYLKQVE